MSTELATYSLSADWLNTSQTNTQVDLSTNSATGDWWYYDYPRPWYVWPTPTTITVDRKIALKLSEVERLRKAAQNDKKLRAILKKFTPLIEITVDFD